MPYEPKPGDGVLFPNEKKTSDKQPNLTGHVLGLDGKKYRLAGWTKLSQKGTKFLSLKMSEFEERSENPKGRDDDEIPF